MVRPPPRAAQVLAHLSTANGDLVSGCSDEDRLDIHSRFLVRLPARWVHAPSENHLGKRMTADRVPVRHLPGGTGGEGARSPEGSTREGAELPVSATADTSLPVFCVGTIHCACKL